MRWIEAVPAPPTARRPEGLSVFFSRRAARVGHLVGIGCHEWPRCLAANLSLRRPATRRALRSSNARHVGRLALGLPVLVEGLAVLAHHLT